MAIQEALLATVQPQALVVLTYVLVDPPTDVTLKCVEDKVKVQPDTVTLV